MDENIPQTVEEIENSKWFKKLNKPEIIAGLESGAELWLKKHGTKSKVGRQLHAALQLYRQSKAGNVLTPRNVAILTFSILYVVWPMDALADIIPVIGWMDDIGVLSLVFTAIISSMATADRKSDDSPQPLIADTDSAETPADQPESAEEAP